MNFSFKAVLSFLSAFTQRSLLFRMRSFRFTCPDKCPWWKHRHLRSNPVLICRFWLDILMPCFSYHHRLYQSLCCVSNPLHRYRTYKDYFFQQQNPPAFCISCCTILHYSDTIVPLVLLRDKIPAQVCRSFEQKYIACSSRQPSHKYHVLQTSRNTGSSFHKSLPIWAGYVSGPVKH